MSDFKILEDKINHVDKTVAAIDTTLKHLTEKLAETVQQNSMALTNHDNRINELERSFHVYDGSIKTLNRLISLCGVAVITGVIWLFTQINQLKQDNAIIRTDYQHLAAELGDLKRQIKDTKNERDIKLLD